MNCPKCQTEMILAQATHFGPKYHYCRTCKKELAELQVPVAGCVTVENLGLYKRVEVEAAAQTFLRSWLAMAKTRRDRPDYLGVGYGDLDLQLQIADADSGEVHHEIEITGEDLDCIATYFGIRRVE